MIEIVSFSERQPLTLQVFAAPCMMTKQMNTDKKRTGMSGRPYTGSNETDQKEIG